MHDAQTICDTKLLEPPPPVANILRTLNIVYMNIFMQSIHCKLCKPNGNPIPMLQLEWMALCTLYTQLNYFVMQFETF